MELDVTAGTFNESRLLRGNALAEAEAWVKDKSLCYQDLEFRFVIFTLTGRRHCKNQSLI